MLSSVSLAEGGCVHPLDMCAQSERRATAVFARVNICSPDGRRGGSRGSAQTRKGSPPSKGNSDQSLKRKMSAAPSRSFSSEQACRRRE